MRILLVHGIGQGGRDPSELRNIWLGALGKGLVAAGASLAPEVAFDFPFYGDRLDAFVNAAVLPTHDDVVEKGPGLHWGFEAFQKSVLVEMQKDRIPFEDVEALLEDPDTQEKGPQNWWWVRALGRAVDKHMGGVAAVGLEKFLREVFLYLNNTHVRATINGIVADALTDEPTVVVGHSLGSVISYDVLRKHPGLDLRGFVTVGSPLGVRAVSGKLGVPENPASDKGGWLNAYDKRDIVALNPLEGVHFPTVAAINNDNSVDNHTDNRHGIIGYLDDPGVAARIAARAS